MPVGRVTTALVDRLVGFLSGESVDAPTPIAGTFEDHPDPLLQVDGDGRISATNSAAEVLLGDGIVDTRVDEVISDDGGIERVHDGVRRRFEGYTLEDPETPSDGVRWIHLRETDTVDGDDGDPLPQVHSFEQYETIMQVLPDPVYATDETGRLTFVNPAFEERFGIDRDTVAESTVHFSEITTAEGARTVAESLRELVAADDPSARETIESVVVTADGRRLTVENSIALRPSHGGFAGAAGVLRDVTERQRREEIFAVMDRALRHNLRTNVNIIAGYAEALESAVDADDVEALRTIQRSAAWLAKLGETIRTIERSIDSTSETDHGVDIERLVTDCARWARERYPQASVDVTASTYGSLDAGDPIAIALRNVIENAIVHNDTAEPTVDVWVTDAPQEGWIEVSVADDGPGIPDEERSVVLGTAVPTQLTHGSGLGLWLTAWIVQVFDGDVEIRENDPQGTVVTLRLRRQLTGDD